MEKGYNPPSFNTSDSLERNFASQPDETAQELRKIRKLFKRHLRRDEKLTTLLCFMCFADIKRSYEYEGTLGLDYLTMSAMVYDLESNGKKKKGRALQPLWNLHG